MELNHNSASLEPRNGNEDDIFKNNITNSTEVSTCMDNQKLNKETSISNVNVFCNNVICQPFNFIKHSEKLRLVSDDISINTHSTTDCIVNSSVNFIEPELSAEHFENNSLIFGKDKWNKDYDYKYGYVEKAHQNLKNESSFQGETFHVENFEDGNSKVIFKKEIPKKKEQSFCNKVFSEKCFILNLPFTVFKFCPRCGIKFSNEIDIENHVNKCITDYINSNFISKEEIVSNEHKLFEKSNVYSIDLKEKELDKSLLKYVNCVDNLEDGNLKNICHVCKKSFSSESYLKTHLQIHSGNRPFSCSTCSKSFTDRTSLKNHKKMHTNERPFKCETCQKCFRRSDSLKYHVASHSKDRPYNCVSCSKKFRTNRDLKTHNKIHIDVTRLDCVMDNQKEIHPFSCTSCSATFSRQSKLKYHKRLFHGSVLHTCPHCNNFFLSQSLLEQHIRIHTGEKPFKCSHCLKAFRRRTHLKIHEKRHTGEGLHKCSECSKGFPQKVELLQHEKIHSGQKLYLCNECGKSFVRDDYLRIHSKTHKNKKEMQKDTVDMEMLMPTYLLIQEPALENVSLLPKIDGIDNVEQISGFLPFGTQ